MLAACLPSNGAPHTEAQWRACRDGVFQADRAGSCSAVAADERADPRRRAMALVQRGILRRDLGQYGRAVADFGRALRVDPSFAEAYVERGLVHRERGFFDIAVRDFDAALAIDPTLPRAIEQRELAVTGQVDNFLEELQLLDDALSRDPINASLLNNRCWLRVINDDDLDAALADCDAAVRIDPRSSEALDSRGLVHLKRGEFELAIADYDAALAIEPGRGHYLYGRGIARMRLGQAEGQADLVAAEAAEPGIGETYQLDYNVKL
jgi:tetratricopeptide (TPR) repeat protein